MWVKAATAMLVVVKMKIAAIMPATSRSRNLCGLFNSLSA